MKFFLINISSFIKASFKIDFDKTVRIDLIGGGFMEIIILFVVFYFFNLISILKVLIFKLQNILNTIY